MKPGKTGLRRLFDATGYSMKGFRAAWTNEAAFRQEMALSIVLLPASFWVATTALEWVILVAPVFILLIVELLNSAIEAVVDRTGDEYHELSGRAKDMGSAAVFVALVLLACSWGAILWRHYGSYLLPGN